MSPRRYDRTLRQAAAEEARRRIIEAAVKLHAVHGAAATSHAMIARAAGVSVPTVYKYFPGRNDLIPACTGRALAGAPVTLDASVFERHRSLPDRVRALTRAVFTLHEYLAPWLRWSEGDAATVPALRDFLEKVRGGRLELLRLALTPPGKRPPSKSALLLGHVLLDFASWKTLTGGGLTTARAADSVSNAILNLVRSHTL